MDFGNCQLLRVLDLEECNNLSEEKLTGICNLLLLKYLSLGGTITKLPREIANLEFLQTLDIRRTNVRTLPIDVMSLPFLVHLLGKFRLTGKAKQMSKADQFFSSGKSNLQTLAGFIVGETEGFLQLLSHMNNLRKIKAWCESISSSNAQFILWRLFKSTSKMTMKRSRLNRMTAPCHFILRFPLWTSIH